jgi:cytochrome P450
MSEPDDDTLPAFPMPRRCPFAPPPEYDELRRAAPLGRVRFLGRPVWVVTRHAEAQALLADPRFSTDPTTPGHPFAAMAGTPEEQAGQFIDLDPPEHDRYRRMLTGEFGARRVRELAPAIQRVVDERIDAMLAEGAADLVAAFAFPVATLVICQLLGVPYADHEYFQARTRRMIAGFFSSDEAQQARRELVGYLGELVSRAEHAPGDDLIGRLVAQKRAHGGLSHDALVGMVFLLLVAGHETTANMLSLGVFTLLEHPGVLAELRAHAELWPDAVDELLRYHSIVDWVAFDRVAREDVELGGQRVRAGEGVFVLGAAANHDERAFADPGALDIHRDARDHLAFGYGIHRCLGQNLARAELEIGYRTLFERVPTLRLAVPAEQLAFKYDRRTFGLYQLPVTW